MGAFGHRNTLFQQPARPQRVSRSSDHTFQQERAQRREPVYDRKFSVAPASRSAERLRSRSYIVWVLIPFKPELIDWRDSPTASIAAHAVRVTAWRTRRKIHAREAAFEETAACRSDYGHAALTTAGLEVKGCVLDTRQVMPTLRALDMQVGNGLSRIESWPDIRRYRNVHGKHLNPNRDHALVARRAGHNQVDGKRPLLIFARLSGPDPP